MFIVIIIWDGIPIYKRDRGTQSQLLVVIAPSESDLEGQLERLGLGGCHWKETSAVSHAGFWKKAKRMQGLWVRRSLSKGSVKVR